MSLWWVGAIVAIFGSVGSNLGINVQKFAFMKAANLPLDQQLKYTRQPLWLLGLSLVIAGALADFAALGLAAQSIVAPIGSVTLVANLFFAHFWLKESLSRRDIIGTCFIISGSVITVAFGDHGSEEYSIQDIRNYFSRYLFIGYAIFMTACSTGMYWFVRKHQPTKIALNQAVRRFDEFKDPGIKADMMKRDPQIQSLLAKYKPAAKILPFCYCALSGILGGQSILFGKMVAVLFATTLKGDNQMFTPFPYLFLLSMLGFVVAQLHFLALALNFFDALYCVPIFQCFFISVSALGGACFFGEFEHFNRTQAILFPLGIFTTLTGVYLLSDRDSSGADSGKVSDECTLAAQATNKRIYPVTPATVWMSFEGVEPKFRVRSRSLGFQEQQQLHTRVSLQIAQEQAAQLHKEGQLCLPDSVHKHLDEYGKRKGSVGGEEGRGGLLNAGRRSRAQAEDKTSVAVTTAVGEGGTGLGLGSESTISRKQKRAIKSQSHPSQFTTPSCLIQSTNGKADDEERHRRRPTVTSTHKAKLHLNGHKNENGASALPCTVEGGGAEADCDGSQGGDGKSSGSNSRLTCSPAPDIAVGTESLPTCELSGAHTGLPALRNHLSAELSCTPQVAGLEESYEELSMQEQSALVQEKQRQAQKSTLQISTARAGKAPFRDSDLSGRSDREPNSQGSNGGEDQLLLQRQTSADREVRVDIDSPLPPYVGDDNSRIAMNLDASISRSDMSAVAAVLAVGRIVTEKKEAANPNQLSSQVQPAFDTISPTHLSTSNSMSAAASIAPPSRVSRSNSGASFVPPASVPSNRLITSVPVSIHSGALRPLRHTASSSASASGSASGSDTKRSTSLSRQMHDLVSASSDVGAGAGAEPKAAASLESQANVVPAPGAGFAALFPGSLDSINQAVGAAVSTASGLLAPQGDSVEMSQPATGANDKQSVHEEMKSPV